MQIRYRKFSQEPVRLLKFLMRFTRESNNHIRTNPALGEPLPDPVDKVRVLPRSVSSAHSSKHCIRSTLQGNVKVLADHLTLCYEIQKVRRKKIWFYRRNADPVQTCHTNQLTQQAEQVIPLLSSVVTDIDAGQDDLLEPLANELFRLTDTFSN